MNKIKNIVLSVALLTSCANAIDYTQTKSVEADEKVSVPDTINMPYAKDYILIGKGKWDKALDNLVKQDKLFKEGNRLLTDNSTFIQKTVLANMDVESKTDDNKTKIIVVADYNGAIKKLSQSAKLNHNPVSAYEAVMISLKMYGGSIKNPISADMPILTKILYVNEVCEGYILYGGLMERQGKNEIAYDIYKNGLKNTKCSGWYQSVLGGKISLYKKAYSK